MEFFFNLRGTVIMLLGGTHYVQGRGEKKCLTKILEKKSLLMCLCYKIIGAFQCCPTFFDSSVPRHIGWASLVYPEGGPDLETHHKWNRSEKTKDFFKFTIPNYILVK